MVPSNDSVREIQVSLTWKHSHGQRRLFQKQSEGRACTGDLNVQFSARVLLLSKGPQYCISGPLFRESRCQGFWSRLSPARLPVMSLEALSKLVLGWKKKVFMISNNLLGYRNRCWCSMKQWSPTFLTLPPISTTLHVVVTPTITLVLLLPYN